MRFNIVNLPILTLVDKMKQLKPCSLFNVSLQEIGYTQHRHAIINIKKLSQLYQTDTYVKSSILCLDDLTIYKKKEK